MVGIRLSALLVAIAMVVSSCGGGISASTCDEVVDETMGLIQRLIDQVDAEAGDRTVQEFLESGDELPSVTDFREDAGRIDEIAADLGCDPAGIASGVDARLGELTATTDLGRFLINAFRSGGL
jgi:hypothetical protein